MADYWKSTGKHYCDFCKCWTADNKVSIQFHEKGKNHQANVKKRLAEIKKNSIDKRKKDEKSQRMFEQMEKAALAAVQKDVNNSDVTVGKTDLRNIVKAHEKSGDSINTSLADSTYPWKSMAGPQGTTYYYNSMTGESTWIMPEIFKKQIEKQQREKEFDNKRPSKEISRKNPSKDPYRAETKKKKEETTPEEIRDSHPLLGGWTTVQTHDDDDDGDVAEDQAEEKKTNPSLQDESASKVNVEEEQQKVEDTGKRFKEKQLKTSIATTSEEPVAFKKRKFGNRNVRKRNDDD